MIVGSFVVVVLSVAAGRALVRLARYDAAEESAFEWALALPAGGLVLAVAFGLASVVGWPPSVPIAAGAGAALWLVGARPRRRERPAPRESALEASDAGSRRLVAALAAAVVAALAVVALAAALEPITAWDAVAIWAAKARWLATASPPGFSWMSDPTLAYAHLDYPPLWPLWLAGDPAFAGEGFVFAGRLLGPSLLAAGAGLLFADGRRRGGRGIGVAAALLWATLPLAGQEAVAGLADLPLATFALIAAIGLARFRDSAEVADLRVAAIGLVGLPWTKSEGLLWAIGLGLVGALQGRGRGQTSARLAWLVAAPGAAVLAWELARGGIPSLHHHSDWREILAGAPRLVGRASELGRALGEVAVDRSIWGGVTIVIGISIAIALTAVTRHRAALVGLGGLAIPLAGLALVLATHELPIAELRVVAMPRLALPAAAIGLLFAAEVMAREGAVRMRAGSAAQAKKTGAAGGSPPSSSSTRRSPSGAR